MTLLIRPRPRERVLIFAIGHMARRFHGRSFWCPTSLEPTSPNRNRDCRSERNRVGAGGHIRRMKYGTFHGDGRAVMFSASIRRRALSGADVRDASQVANHASANCSRAPSSSGWLTTGLCSMDTNGARTSTSSYDLESFRPSGRGRGRPAVNAAIPSCRVPTATSSYISNRRLAGRPYRARADRRQST